MKLLALVVALGACSGSSSGGGTTTPPKSAEKSCAQAADGMVAILLVHKDPPPPDDASDKIRGLIRRVCESDGWSASARKCLSEMKTADDANVCGTLLTDDQQAALVRAQGENAGAKPP